MNYKIYTRPAQSIANKGTLTIDLIPLEVEITMELELPGVIVLLSRFKHDVKLLACKICLAN